MKVLIVFNHPYEKSFCNAMLAAVTRGLRAAGHEVDLIHLDRDGFDPVMRQADLKAFRDQRAVDKQVLAYRRRVERADFLLFIFPIWWELMPALTKGFVDKVVFPGIFYENTKSGLLMRPLLQNLRGVHILTTMNTPRPVYRLWLGNAVQRALVRGTFRQMGYRHVRWRGYGAVKFAGHKRRSKWLRALERSYARLR